MLEQYFPILLQILLAGGFAGRVDLVNPHRIVREGAGWADSIDRLAAAPDLSEVVTPAASIPGIIEQLGAIGTK